MRVKGIYSSAYILIATTMIAVGRIYDERLELFGINFSILLSSLFIILSIPLFMSVKSISFSSSRRILYFFIGFVTISPLLWSFYGYNEYGVEKYVNFILIILPLIFIVTNLFKYKDVSVFFKILLLFITLLSVLGAIKVGASIERLSVLGGGPIVFARWMMIGVLILFFLKKTKMVDILLLLLFFFLALAAGSRGPVLALVLTFSIYIFLNFQRVIIRLFTTVFLILTILLLVDHGFSINDFGKAERLVTKDSTSENVRLKFAKRSLELVVAYPFGVGIGNWQDYCNKSKPFHLLKHQYPHNLVFEVFAELGIIGGILFLLLILKSLYLTYFRMTNISNSYEIYSLLFYLQIFLFVNSCFSGNLNDARFLFVVIAISLIKEPLIKEKNA